MQIKIKRMSKDFIKPSFKKEGSPIIQFKAMQDIKILPKEMQKISLGLGVEIQTEKGETIYGGVELQLRPPRYLIEKGITAPVGTVDAQYRGEIAAILHNQSKNALVLQKGEVVCEGIVNQIPILSLEVASNLSESQRGENGFGSTGEK